MTARKRKEPKWEPHEYTACYRGAYITVRRAYHHYWGWSIFASCIPGEFHRTLGAAQRAAVKAVDRALDGGK